MADKQKAEKRIRMGTGQHALQGTLFLAVETILMHARGYEAWKRSTSVCLPGAAPARKCRAIVTARRCTIVDQAGTLCQSRTLEWFASRADADAFYAREGPDDPDVAWTLVRMLEVNATSKAQASKAIFYGFPQVRVLAQTPKDQIYAQASAHLLRVDMS